MLGYPLGGKMKTNHYKATFMATQVSEMKSSTELVISWEPLPDDFQLEDEPVENTEQPILAGALQSQGIDPNNLPI